jgi:hypothetical protein
VGAGADQLEVEGQKQAATMLPVAEAEEVAGATMSVLITEVKIKIYLHYERL